jgi:hypothetical protein
MGTGAAAAGLAGAAATAGAGDLGPAVAAVKANVARSVAVIKTVKNPIFFIRPPRPSFGADAARKINAHGSPARDTRTV